MSLDDRIAAIARVARRWLDKGDALRRQALAVLPAQCHLSAPMAAWGLDRAFEVAGEDRLGAWWEREGSPSGTGEGTTSGPGRRIRCSGHVWAGNVFVAGLPPVVASLLAGVPARVKAPSSCPAFADLLVRSFDREPSLHGMARAASWSRQDADRTRDLLDHVDVLFAFGQDASIDALRGAAPPRLRFRGFGHRYSVAVIASEALRRGDAAVSALLHGLAVDHLAWDGAGCLTPRWILVDGTAAEAEALARRTAGVLPRIVNEMPGATLSAGQGAERAAWLARAAFSGWSASGPGWGAAALPEPLLLPAPPARVMCFLPVPGPGSPVRLLAPLGRTLQGLAFAGPAEQGERLARDLAPLGLSRVAAPGQLQRPPIDWDHDDVRILASLR